MSRSQEKIVPIKNLRPGDRALWDLVWVTVLEVRSVGDQKLYVRTDYLVSESGRFTFCSPEDTCHMIPRHILDFLDGLGL